jgi:hypothetical protein
MKNVLAYFLIPAALYLLCCAMDFRFNDINWDRVKSFRLYEYNFSRPLGKLSESEIEKMRYVEISMSEVRGIMQSVKKKNYEMFLWKGRHLAVIEFEDGKVRKILISNYAGVLYDFDYKQFYQFEGPSRLEWEQLIQKYKEKLYKNTHK